MIGYIEGKILAVENDRLLILANQVGYEVLIPAVVMKSGRSKSIGDQASFFIYYHQTERQPKPVLIGFNTESEKEFFQLFISVGDIGPLKAVKAMNVPMEDIADAIEQGNAAALKQLKGIGVRTAQKIIATLSGKMTAFARQPDLEKTETIPEPDFTNTVLEVLVSQLGHKSSDARDMISKALKRNRAISTPEELFDEVYRGE